MADEFLEDLVAFLPNLKRFALSLCRSGDVADDLVQITCEKALAHRSAFDPATRLDAWLFRILRNSWIDLTRRRKTQGTTVDIDAAFDLQAGDGARLAENRLMLNDVGVAIMELPVEQREVLLLVCVEEMSYKDAANVLAIPVGTVMSRLARARTSVAKRAGIN